MNIFDNYKFKLDDSDNDKLIKNNKFELGENGSVCYKSTNNPGLDLFFKLVRDIDNDNLIYLIENIIKTNNSEYIAELFVQCFQVRNCRGGKGERLLSYKIMYQLYLNFPLTVFSLIHLYKDYGYWNDLNNLLFFVDYYIFDDNDKFKNKIIQIYSNQLKEDKIKIDNGETKISLAAKWAPRENHKFSKKHRNLFNDLLFEIFPYIQKNKRYKAYRQLISSLNTYLNTTEILMCNGSWSKINYSTVPSLNLKKWRKAHLNELCKIKLTNSFLETGNRYPDNEDRINARKNLLSTIRDPEKKISGKQLMPHEITRIFFHDRYNNIISESEQELLQTQWETLKSTVISKGRKAIPLCDVSGSMSGLPMDVSIGLGILLSEITHDNFKNLIITFHEVPCILNLSDCSNLKEKVHKLSESEWGGNTNLEKVFDLILDIIDKNDIKSEDIPDLVIFSDMQFDEATNFGKKDFNTNLNIIKNKFKTRNLICPRIIFWNLRDSIGYPSTENSENIIMLSGFSPSLLKFILENEIVSEPTPLEVYLDIINDTQYDPIRLILNDSNEGILINYKFNVI